MDYQSDIDEALENLQTLVTETRERARAYLAGEADTTASSATGTVVSALRQIEADTRMIVRLWETDGE